MYAGMIQYFKGPVEIEGTDMVNSLFLNWDIQLLLPLDINMDYSKSQSD